MKHLLAFTLFTVIIIIAGRYWRSKPNVKLATSAPSCSSDYAQQSARNQIDLRIVFGYKDANPSRFVGDRYERAYIVQEILKMGFQREPSDDDVFWLEPKMFQSNGKKIKLTLAQSSATADDKDNRKNGFQSWKTKNAQQIFVSGLKEADAVFYNGHSRDGGGPDFGPPKVTSSGKVNYPWYQKQQPGNKEMLAALKERPGLPVLGLFSCKSEGHFAKQLRKATPKTSILGTSELIYYIDSLNQLLEALRGFLEQTCSQSVAGGGLTAPYKPKPEELAPRS